MSHQALVRTEVHIEAAKADLAAAQLLSQQLGGSELVQAKIKAALISTVAALDSFRSYDADRRAAK